MTRTFPVVLFALVALSVGACTTHGSNGGTDGQNPNVTDGADNTGNSNNPNTQIGLNGNTPVGDTNQTGNPLPAAPAGAVNSYTGGLGQNSFPNGPSLSPNSGYVRYIGRVETNAPGGVRLNWGGTAVQVRVTGATNVSITMQANQHMENNVMGVLIDGNQTQIIRVIDADMRGSSAPYRVTVPTGDHLVTFIKRTETGNGAVFISNISTDGQFEPIAGTGRLVEFIGDNATAGYSSDGPVGVPACAQPVNSVANPNQQNAANTYGVLAANAFGADWSLLAYSSRGLIQNYDGSTAMNLADMYPRLNPLDTETVVKVSPNAGVVVVNVGTNDINYWMQNKVGTNPNVPAFTAAYVALFQKIKALNPNAAIIATVGPTLGNYQCITGSSAADYACSAGGTLPALTTLKSAVQAAVSQASSSGAKVTFVEFPANSTDVSACYLPDAVGHKKMADLLIPAIAQATGWSQGSAAAQPAPAAKGAGPKTLTGTFAPWPDPLADPNAARLVITNKQFPQCHYCSPTPANPAYIGTAACPTLLGVSEPCQSYCHMPDGYQEPHGTNPPTSGNHYSTPAVNAAEFTSPVPRGKWIHSMEHGAIVLAYNCPNGCATELAVLRQAYQANNNNGSWIIFTPDPLLPGPARFAALAWTYSLRFDTPDLNTLNCFIKQHAFYGRECFEKGGPASCSPLLDKPMGSEEG